MKELKGNMRLFAEIAESMGTKLSFVAQRAKQDKGATFDNLMHLINEESLKGGRTLLFLSLKFN